MKLNKETLKRIIKEELDAIMNETMTIPSIGGGVTPEQQIKINKLINSGNEDYVNQARSFVDALGGDPSYVDYILDMEYQEITSLAHQQRDDIDSSGPLTNDSEPDFDPDFYNSVDALQKAHPQVDGRYSDTPERSKEALRRYDDTYNSRKTK